MMPLALFDLDNTLIDGDSDYLWGCFLADQGVVDADGYRQEHERYLHDYECGILDIEAFVRFSLRPLHALPRARLEALRALFVTEMIEPIVLPAAEALVAEHRERGDTLVIVTATNAFLTAPLAARFGVPHLIATLPEERDGRFTGAIAGIPAFREGKVKRLNAWLQARAETLDESYFYSDSHNDLPLLEAVAHPVAVDPDPHLRETATQRGWEIRSLRHAES